jgi:hypothetical protein
MLLKRVPASASEAVVRLRDLAFGAAPPPASAPPPPLAPADHAAQALLATAASPSAGDADLDSAAFKATMALDQRAREDLLGKRIFGLLWAELQDRLGLQPPPRGWRDWLDRLSDADFDAAAYAVSGARDWALKDVELDAAVAADLARRLLAVSDGLAADRLADAMPFLYKWAEADARWPRPSLAPVYLAMLTCMALGRRRGAAMMQSAAPLLEGTLRSGLGAAEYREALEAAAEIARPALDRSSAFDVLEMLEAARSVAPADAAALESFGLGLVAGLARQIGRLTAGQRQSLRSAAAELGWDETLQEDDGPAEQSLASALAGRSIAIYTLTEPAARAARDQLLAIAPDLRIDLNHDHGGTRVLGALAERVDLFVLVALSATHAATDFIRARCPLERLAYAPGRVPRA